MIIIRYTGGLGNQMFIYAMQLMLQKKYPKETIYADLSRYVLTDEHDGFDIEKYFNVKITPLEDNYLKIIAPLVYLVDKVNISNKISKKIGIGRIEKINDWFEKRNKRICMIKDYFSTCYNQNVFLLTDIDKIYHYKGNWINTAYWENNFDYIINSFEFKLETIPRADVKLLEEMKKEESVAIHVRGGDYSGNPCYDLCGEMYYSKAIKAMQDRTGANTIYYVFAEEETTLPDCIKNLNYQFISHSYAQAGIDLWMMAQCKHNIIANSTFSYWSALLNRNRSKIVIAPLYVYKKSGYLEYMPVPDDWIKISNILM